MTGPLAACRVPNSVMPSEVPSRVSNGAGGQSRCALRAARIPVPLGASHSALSRHWLSYQIFPDSCLPLGLPEPYTSNSLGGRAVLKPIIVTVADNALGKIHEVADQLAAKGMKV